MRCCGNCEWSISFEMEDIILKENSQYKEEDLDRPRAGDCCLMQDHNGKYVCECHDYNSGGLETYVFYDDKYLGAGYFIVTTYDEEVVKFLKLYRTRNGHEYTYYVRAWEDKINVIDDRKEIVFDLDYMNHYGGRKYTWISNDCENTEVMLDKNCSVKYIKDRKATYMVINGDVNNGFIDIMFDKNNKSVLRLYRDLAVISCNKEDKDMTKKVIRIKEKK